MMSFLHLIISFRKLIVFRMLAENLIVVLGFITEESRQEFLNFFIIKIYLEAPALLRIFF